MSKERIRPMPTAEQKARAQFEMASADPFAFAMKSVDDRFPDSREKDAKTLKEEAEVEAMVRRVMAKKRMAAAQKPAVEQPMQKPVAEQSAVQKPVTSEKPVAQAPVAQASAVQNSPAVEQPIAEKPVLQEPEIAEPTKAEAEQPEKPAVEKAIEEAFEEDAATEENFDDYDDIDEMEDGLYDELDDSDAEDAPVDDGIVDNDAMKTEILDEDLLKDELEKTDFTSDEPEVMDDFDDETEETVEETTETEPVKEDANGRPVNMVLGKKSEEPVEAAKSDEVAAEIDGEKEKIRAKQMDFGAENATKNPLVDDGKPAPEIKKVEQTITPKTQVKMMGVESKQKKMMVAVIVLAVLALGGVLFGVVAMIKQGKASEELAEQMAMVVSGSNTSDNVDDEYIYVKDWGLKIKIIAGLTDVSYNVANDDLAEVMIWGAKKDNSVSYTPDFARQAKNSNPLGTVVRVARYERAAAGRLIWYDDYYNYYYQGPTGIPSVSESEMNWWVESYLLIKEMLTNADNYTTMEESNTIGQQQ